MGAENRISEQMSYPREVIEVRARFLEAVYFPKGKRLGDVMGKYVSIAVTVQQTLDKALANPDKWPGIIRITDFLVDSTTPVMREAIRSRFGFDDGIQRSWNEVGRICGGISKKAAFARAQSAYKKLRTWDKTGIRVGLILTWQTETEGK